MKKVKKAIIPAAGLGTRFLPATKTVPKEMLTIVDAPIIFYVVEEAARAGIEDIILIAGRGKTAIEDFFDVSYELEDKLLKDGKIHLLERLIKLREMTNIISIRQKQPLGLGHAVLCGQAAVGKEPFAVLLGDEIMVSMTEEPNVTEQLVSAYSETDISTVAVMQVNDSEVSKYGIIEIGKIVRDGFFKVKSVVEKPTVSSAPSRWALPGRYVFDAKIFEYLKETKPGYGNEIQLTDGMSRLAREVGLNATQFSATRFDAGDKLGYLQANVELAMMNPELSASTREYILRLAERIR